MRLRVLHGPNLNLLGSREPEIYGTATLADIDAMLVEEAGSHQVECDQSNREGQLIDWVQAAAGHFDGLLFNFGAFTHTSVALADALSAVRLPCVEVHLSNVHAREAFRHRTLTGAHALGVVTGFGPRSYTLGLRALIDYLTDAASG